MAHRNPPDSGTASLVESYPHPPGRTTLDAIAAIPEEHVWLASRKSPRTRRAYRQDVEHFMRTIGIRSADELRGMDHRAVLAWEAYMREVELAEASTIRRRLAALSSLFKHLIRQGAADRNPVRDVERPPINRREGSTLAFSQAQARRLLDAPSPDTIAGLRDRAILSVGLQAGLRRAEIEDEAIAPALFIWNPEVGRRSVGVGTYWVQAVCQNHIVWVAAEVVEFSRKQAANVHDSLRKIRRLVEGLVDRRDARRDGFVDVMGKAMGQKLGDDADEVLKVLNERGITKKLAKEALEIARQRGGFTAFALVDALTRISGKLANADDGSEADAKASALLALAASRCSPPPERRPRKVDEATHHAACLHFRFWPALRGHDWTGG